MGTSGHWPGHSWGRRDQPHHRRRDEDFQEGRQCAAGSGAPRQAGYWEIGLIRGNTGRGEVFLWSVPDGAEARETAARIGLETARDEARISLAAVGLSEEAGRAGFRFNMLVSDNDGGGRESCLAISPGLGDGKDPGLYPVVKF